MACFPIFPCAHDEMNKLQAVKRERFWMGQFYVLREFYRSASLMNLPATNRLDMCMDFRTRCHWLTRINQILRSPLNRFLFLILQYQIAALRILEVEPQYNWGIHADRTAFVLEMVVPA